MAALSAWIDSDDDSSMDTIQGLVDARLARWYEYLEHCRYFARPRQYRATTTMFERDLGGIAGVDDRDWLNDEEFLHDFRVTRTFFFALVERISDHPVFQPKVPADGSAP
jgi:hypothetical protein